MKHALILGLASVLLPGAAVARSPADAAAKQARIPFANHGGIDSWRAEGNRALLIEGHRKWYRAELLGHCPDLDFATAIGFDTGPNGDFDSFSSIIVRGRRCAVASLTEVPAPPKKVRTKKAGKASV